jgi:hypothetical protein
MQAHKRDKRITRSPDVAGPFQLAVSCMFAYSR